MASERMTSLVTDHDTACFNAGYEVGKGYGPVSVRYPLKAISTRLALLREIDLLEEKTDMWRRARRANGIEEGE